MNPSSGCNRDKEDATPAARDSIVEIVPIQPAEAAEIAAMAGTIWREVYPGMISKDQIDYMLGWMYDPARLEDEICDGGIDYFWILGGGTKAGFLSVGPVHSGSSCPLHKFYLLLEFHGRGLGSAAMGLLVKRLKASGVDSADLRVNRNNAAAIAFYRKHGFFVFSEDCCEIGGGYVMDDLLMRRFLAESS